MSKYRNLAWVSLITLLLLNTITFLTFPLEGGGLLLLLSLAWLLYLGRQKPAFLISKGLAFALILAAYLLLISNVSYRLPANPYTVFISLIFISLALALYVTLETDERRILWENSLIFAFFIVFLLQLLETVFFYSSFLRTMPKLNVLGDKISLAFRVPGVFFAHPNVAAGFLNFVWPIVLIRLIHAQSRPKKILWVLALTLMGLTLLLAISRGAMIGALFAGAFFLYRSLRSEATKENLSERIPNRARPSLLPIGLGVLLFSLLLIGIVWRATTSGQINLFGLGASRLLTVLDSLSSGRALLWNYAWEAFLNKPILGHGNAGFPVAYVHPAQLPPGFLALSAHNLWLNVAVEYGIVGLLFLFALLAICFGKAVDYLKKQGKPLVPSDAYLAGALGFLGHQLFDSMLWVPTYLASFMILLVLLLRYTLSFGEWRFGRRQFLFLSFLLTLALLYSYVALTKMIAPSYAYYSSTESVSNPHTSQNNICALANRYTQNALYSFECSMELVEQLSADFSEQTVPQKAQLALHYQERGIELDPYWPPQKANLAVLHWLNGNREVALEIMRETASNTPRNPLIWLNLGWMEEQLGNSQQALAAYERVVRLSPLVLRSNFAHLSALFSSSAYVLETWMTSRTQWDEWYEYEIVDKDFMSGIIALGLGRPEDALSSLQLSAERFEPNYPSFYAYLAYALYLSDQREDAYPIAHDLALLDQSGLYKMEDPLLTAIAAFILYESEQPDLAYPLFMNSYLLQTRASEPMYYSHVYRQPILKSDISPLLIRNLYILEETRPGWEWFVKQTSLRESPSDAEKVVLWYRNLPGIALLEED
ncbi:MAG: O-antigen ligase family protein [Anaerolineales bacterium]|nr:O-antigen ligase family protein [Anaerolineales bacterium]MDW8161191.1 O-antigen ligase family protein [Anaerolineales bacterium]